MTEADIRAAAARGESTPVSPAGWLRLALRAVGLISLLLVFVPDDVRPAVAKWLQGLAGKISNPNP